MAGAGRRSPSPPGGEGRMDVQPHGGVNGGASHPDGLGSVVAAPSGTFDAELEGQAAGAVLEQWRELIERYEANPSLASPMKGQIAQWRAQLEAFVATQISPTVAAPVDDGDAMDTYIQPQEVDVCKDKVGHFSSQNVENMNVDNPPCEGNCSVEFENRPEAPSSLHPHAGGSPSSPTPSVPSFSPERTPSARPNASKSPLSSSLQFLANLQPSKPLHCTNGPTTMSTSSSSPPPPSPSLAPPPSSQPPSNPRLGIGKTAWKKPEHIPITFNGSIKDFIGHDGAIRVDHEAVQQNIQKLEKGLVGRMLGRHIPFA